VPAAAWAACCARPWAPPCRSASASWRASRSRSSNFIDLDPADFGGRIEVDTGCVVAFEEGIQYGVQRVGGLNRQGLMNAVFGGEGLSLATLEGNGRVILQSLTIESLANALKKDQGGDKQGPTGGMFSTNAG
jgi:hypothetical protein